MGYMETLLDKQNTVLFGWYGFAVVSLELWLSGLI